MTRVTEVVGAVVIIAALQAVPVPAQESPLSIRHTDHGVSQFWAGHFRDENSGIRLANPTRREHMVAMITYTRDRDSFARREEARENATEGETRPRTERYVACSVRRLTPHASLDIDTDLLVGEDPDQSRRYAEIISVPSRAARLPDGRATRLANGLGIVAFGGRQEYKRSMQPVFPRLFTLPRNNVVPGQRQAAIDCVCAHMNIAFFDVPANVFAPFGITCN